MAKGKMKTSTKVMLGAGGLAAAGGIGYYFYRKWRDEKDEEAEDAYVETHTEAEETEKATLSAEQSAALSQALKIRKDLESRMASVVFQAGGGSVSSPLLRQMPAGGEDLLPIILKIQKPKARLRFDKEHYQEHQASKLLRNFHDKQEVSFEKAVSILKWDCTGKGPPTSMTHSGTHIPLGSPEPIHMVYYAKIAGRSSTPEVMNAMLHAFNPDKAKDKLSTVLQGPGFYNAPVENAPLTKEGEHNYLTRSDEVKVWLTPGTWVFVTRVNVGHAGSHDGVPWKYWKGYWGWTGHGPDTLSCAVQRERFFSGKKCSNHITVFGRWAYIQSLEHIIRIVEVTKAGTIALQPMFTINIGNLHYYRTDAAESFGLRCRIANKIINLAEKVSGWDIRSIFNSFAELCGC